MQGWHLLSRNPHQDCFSNGSNGQTKQDVAVQHHQVHKQIQALQVPCHLHAPPWLLNVDPEKRIQALETKCLRKLLLISFLEHTTNDLVRSKINVLVGPQEILLATVTKQELVWLGHVTRHDSLSRTTLED